MSRDFDQINRAAQDSSDTVTRNDTLALPPGYIQGYGVTLHKDYTVTVNGGSANVQGKQVKLEDAHLLALEDWVAPRMDTPQHYYIYLAAGGQIYVDIVAPKFNDFYGYYEQPDYGWRAIGKLFSTSTQIIYAIQDVTRSGRSVTVAPFGYIGYADYYCDGTNDEILINAALLYEWSAYQGGSVQLLDGTFKILSSIVMYSRTSLKGSSRATVIQVQDVLGASMIQFGGTSTVHYNNVTISGITFDSNGLIASGIGMYYTDSSIIKENYLINMTVGISIYGSCSYVQILGNEIDGRLTYISGSPVGIKVSDSNFNVIGDNSIHDILVTANVAPYSYYGIYTTGVSSNNIIRNNAIYNLNATISTTPGIGVNLNSGGGAYNSIIGNQIRSCKAPSSAGYGIQVAENYANITSNYCFDNGTDTGISNANANNFIISGTSPQVKSNSWQDQTNLKTLPVAAETSYSVTTQEGVQVFSITTGAASDYTINLPALAGCLGTRFSFSKIDSGAKEVILDASGAETFLYQGASSTTIRLSIQYKQVTIEAFASGWEIVAGELAPVSGEPSLGTPHPTSDANRTSTLVVNTSTNTAGVWSAAVTMTGVPAGAKAAWCRATIIKASVSPALAVEAATGYTLSDITSGTNIFKYWGFPDAVAGSIAGGIILIHLDANGQFKWCTSISSSTVKIGSAIDYEL